MDRIIITPEMKFIGHYLNWPKDISFEVTFIVKDKDYVTSLEFPSDQGKLEITSVKLNNNHKPLIGIKTLKIPKTVKDFHVSDYCFPDLISIDVEEGAPFYSRGVNLFSKRGKLLNFFRPDHFELMEKSLIPLNPDQELMFMEESIHSLLAPVDTLVLPPMITKGSFCAFYEHVPRRLVCSQLLLKNSLIILGEPSTEIYIQNVKYIKELVLTSPTAPLPIDFLQYYTGLESISFPNGHDIYEIRDGFVYKDNGATLVYVPPCHPQVRQGTIHIPEGVRHLTKNLFKGCKTLKHVEMPDSVCTIGEALFADCRNLEYVRLSDSIEHIPGGKRQSIRSYHYVVYPPFYRCEKLTSMKFSKNLVSIGADAFSRSGIKRVELQEGIEELGEYSFNDCLFLREVLLPKSLKRVKRKAFTCSTSLRIWAYEGTAKGLLSSVNFLADNYLAWIHVLDPKGYTTNIIPVPQGNLSEVQSLLSKAWDGDHLCLDALFQCIPYLYVASRTEMILVALCHLDKKSFAPYEKYRHRKYTDYGIDLIERDQWDDFCHFLELANLHRGMRKVLLDYCNQTNHVRYIPPLLELDHKKSDGKGIPSMEKGKFNL